MEPTGLAQYAIQLRDDWLDIRKKLFEPRWNTNYQLVNSIDPDTTSSWKSGEGGTKNLDSWRSDTFVPLPKAKLMAALSMCLEVLLQGGELPFTLKASEASAYDTLPEERQAQVDDAVERMIDLIREQHRDRKIDRRYLKHLMSLLMYGETVSKYNVESVLQCGFKQEGMDVEGLFPEEAQEYAEWTYYEEEKDVPGHVYVSLWNFLWDYENEDFRENRGQIELLEMSAFELRQKKGLPLYDDEAIERAISEHQRSQGMPDKESGKPGFREIEKRKRNMDAFEAWIRAPRKLVDEFEKESWGQEAGEIDADGLREDETGDDVEVMLQVVNQEIIRFARIESKDRVYRRAKWEDILDRPDGIGIPDNLRGISKALNGMQRAFEDNKKLSANVIVALKRSMLAKPNQADEIYPGMQIDISESAEDVRQAIFPIAIPDVGETLISGIANMERWGDTASMIPQILQGYTLPKQKTDTAYEIGQLLEQAGKYLGRGIRNIDEGLIEPEVTDVYKYNMQDPEVPPDHKADAKVHAGGFNSFQDRIVKAQKMKELLAMVISSEILLGEVKVAPHLKAIYQSEDFDPDEFILSQEEKDNIQQARMEMEQQARMQALKDLRDQQMIEAEAKIAEEKAKSDMDQEEEILKSRLNIREETHKANLERESEEEEFQRTVIKDALHGARKEAEGGGEMRDV